MSRVTAPFAPPPSQLPHLAPRQRVRRFSVDEYHRLIEQGYFAADERYELLEGWIVAKMPRNPPHDVAITLADAAVRPHLGPEWFVRVQSAITLSDSEPEPDLAVVRSPARRYVNRHPTPADIALLIESAASSLELDRADKGRIYAAAGIPVYWILNVTDRQVEAYTDPRGAGATAAYRQQVIYAGDDAVPLVIDGAHLADIPVHELLP